MIVNLTPHTVSVYDQSRTLRQSFPPESLPIRVSQKTVTVGELENVPIVTTHFGELENAPTFQDGVWYIVSRLVKQADPDRTDFLVPGEAIRDNAGNIIGCIGLSAT